MDSKAYVFSELKDKYYNFLNATVCVYVSGKKIDDEFVIDDVSVENTILMEEIGGASVKLRRNDSIINSSDNENLLSAFPLMTKIKIEMGYQDKRDIVFEGIIYERNLVLVSDYDTYVSIICVDNKALFRLNNTYSNYQNIKSYSDVVNSIISKYPVRAVVDKDEAFSKPMTLSQYGLNDFEYISKIATEIGYEFFALYENVYFRKARSIQANLIAFEQNNLYRLQHRTSMSHILSEIKLLTHDQDKNESKIYDCNTVQNKVGSGLTGVEILNKNKIAAVNHESCYSGKRIGKDYKKQAECMLQENSMELTEVTFLIDGIPQIIPGRFIKIENVKCVENTYYIKKAVHKYTDKMYRTEIVCCSNTSKF